jgi:protease-4
VKYRFALALLASLAFACEPRARTLGSGGSGTPTPSLGERRVLEFDLRGGAPEALAGGLFQLPATRSYTGLVRALERGLEEDTTASVFVRLGEQTLELAQAQEVGALLTRYAKKGIPVVCHADGLSNATAALVAQGCTRRFLSPAGGLETVGLAAQVVYMRGILDRLKIEADFLHVGRFKSGPEPLTHEGPSPEARESLEVTLASLRKSWLEQVRPELRGALEQGPFTPNEAKAQKLVDTLGYELDALAEAKKLGKVDVASTAFGASASASDTPDVAEILRMIAGASESVSDRPHVAVIPAQGAISTQSDGGVFSSGGITSKALVKTLRRLSNDDSVKAVVLRIDSPGGSPLASDLIWHEVMELRKKKPVVASVGGMAASGGYYIACAAQRIFAEPSSIVGSIGVFGGKIVIGPALGEIGVNSVTFPASPEPGAAERAAYLSPLTRWDDPTRKRMQSMMEGIYELFIARVAEGRKVADDKVRPHAEGRIWSGTQGLERGLVDEIGGLSQALASARKLAKLDEDVPVTVEGGAEGLLEMLLLGEEAGEAQVIAALKRLDTRRALTLEAVPEELRPFAATLGPLLAGETVLTAMPFALTVR